MLLLVDEDTWKHVVGLLELVNSPQSNNSMEDNQMNNEFDFINNIKFVSNRARRISETSKIDTNDDVNSSIIKAKMKSPGHIDFKDRAKNLNSGKFGEFKNSSSYKGEFTKLQSSSGNQPKHNKNKSFRNNFESFKEEKKNWQDSGGDSMSQENSNNSPQNNLINNNEINSEVNEVEEVESFEAPADVKANAVSKDSFIKSMSDIKQLILARDHKPETRINLMNTVMHEMRRVTDPKSKQEITELFNENDLILHFIKSFLRMTILGKLKAKFKSLEMLDYNQTFNDKFQWTNWQDSQLDRSFLDHFKKQDTPEYDNSHLFMTIYWWDKDMLNQAENENCRKIIDLLLSLVQNNAEGVHNFIIEDIKSSNTWSIYHSLAYMFLNSDSEELHLSIWLFLKTVVKPIYSTNSSLASRYLFERIISYHFINYLVFLKIRLQAHPEQNTVAR
jgi:hypothetical protein